MGYSAACCHPHILTEIDMSATHPMYNTIALVVRPNTTGIEEPVRDVLDFLKQGGYSVVLEADTAEHLAIADFPR